MLKYTDGAAVYNNGDSITYQGQGWNIWYENEGWWAANDIGEEIEFEPGMEDAHFPS